MKHLLSDIWTAYGREMKRFMAQKSRIAMILIQPLVWLLLMGSALAGLTATSSLHVFSVKGGYLAFMSPGIMVMTALFSATFCGFSLVLDRTSGYLDRMLCSPLNRSAIPLGKMTAIACQSALQAGAIAAIALFMDVRFASGIGGFFCSIAICSLFAFAMAGLSLAVSAGFSSIEGLHPVLNFLTMPLMFTSTTIFPREAMPQWMKVVSDWNPLTAAVEPMRVLVLDGWVWTGILPGLFVTTAFALTMAIVAALRFRQLCSK